MSAVFIVALQLAPAAFPAWRVGTNELAAETTAPATVAAQLAIRQTPATALMPPSTPLRPADKAVVPRTPFALAWPEAGNPGVRYQIDVSADDAFVAPLVPVLHHPAAVPRLILDAQSLENFAPGHTYYWRVRLIDPWGRASAFSPAWSFRVE